MQIVFCQNPGWMIGTEAHVRVGSQVKYGCSIFAANKRARFCESSQVSATHSFEGIDEEARSGHDARSKNCQLR